MGRNISEKAVSLSQEVKELIEFEPFIRNPLAEGLINYSALARQISDKIERKLNRKIKEESLIVAIKRYADEIKGKAKSNGLTQIFANSSLSMQEDVSYALLNSNNGGIVESIESLLKSSDWHPGEVRIIVESPGRIAVVLKSVKMNALLENIEEDEIVNISKGNSLITMRVPFESQTTYGIIAEIAAALSKKGISIELVSATPDLHFLVNEGQGEETYKLLKEMIITAKQKHTEK